MSLENYYRNLVEGKRRGIDVLALRPILHLLAVPYALIMRLRALAYRTGLLRTYRLAKPVISVGNITVGGTGKTPVVAWLARYLMDKGKRVVVLSRGYGGSMEGIVAIVSDGHSILLTPAEAGDEPYMLAKRVPGLMVVIGADRYQAGLHAQEVLEPDIFILDDGFQHLRLHRDLNILLMDNMRPFANGHVLPAGLLREPQDAARRADLIIYTRCGENEPAGYFTGIPFCGSSHVLVGAVSISDGTRVPLSDFSHLRGIAFAGIAEPAAFFSLLEEAGMRTTSNISFPDHCNYGEKEISKIVSAMEAAEADYAITTEKDSVKLSSYLPQLGRMYAAVLDIKIADVSHLAEKLEKVL